MVPTRLWHPLLAFETHDFFWTLSFMQMLFQIIILMSWCFSEYFLLPTKIISGLTLYMDVSQSIGLIVLFKVQQPRWRHRCAVCDDSCQCYLHYWQRSSKRFGQPTGRSKIFNPGKRQCRYGNEIAMTPCQVGHLDRFLKRAIEHLPIKLACGCANGHVRLMKGQDNRATISP